MQQNFRRTCVETLEHARLLRQYEKGKYLLWLFQAYIEWDTLSNWLINLLLVPAGDDVHLAWSADNDIYEFWKKHSSTCLDRRWKNIDDLRSRAIYARELVQGARSMLGTLPGDGRDSGSVGSEHFDFVDRNSPDGSAPVGQSERSPCTLQGEDATENLDIPSTGTGCQWSEGIFEKYFQVLDSKYYLHNSWL